jgi:hypothetical protein
MKCQQCGAMIDPTVHACPFCKITTAAGVEARKREEWDAQQRAQWEAAQGAQQAAVGARQLDSTATWSLVCAGLGIVSCCTPFSIVGLVQGIRARGMAQRFRVPLPTKATIGLVLSIFSSVWSVSWITYGIIQSHYDQEAATERSEALQKRVAEKATQATLEHNTACALAEIYALQTGYSGHPGSSLDHFECVGKLRNAPDAAELQTFRFKSGSSAKRYAVNACFKKGARWYVTELRADACPDVAQP